MDVIDVIIRGTVFVSVIYVFHRFYSWIKTMHKIGWDMEIWKRRHVEHWNYKLGKLKRRFGR